MWQFFSNEVSFIWLRPPTHPLQMKVWKTEYRCIINQTLPNNIGFRTMYSPYACHDKGSIYESLSFQNHRHLISSKCTYNSTNIQYQYQRLSRACIVHLVIKKTNWSYVKTMSCSGSHLEITINIKNTKFVKDLPMIDAQFRFNQCNSFREEYISVFSPYGPVLILWPVVAAILDFRSA